jgi:hypothetical protein
MLKESKRLVCSGDLGECVLFYYLYGSMKGSIQHGLLWFMVDEKKGYELLSSTK